MQINYPNISAPHAVFLENDSHVFYVKLDVVLSRLTLIYGGIERKTTDTVAHYQGKKGKTLYTINHFSGGVRVIFSLSTTAPASSQWTDANCAIPPPVMLYLKNRSSSLLQVHSPLFCRPSSNVGMRHEEDSSKRR